MCAAILFPCASLFARALTKPLVRPMKCLRLSYSMLFTAALECEDAAVIRYLSDEFHAVNSFRPSNAYMPW